MADPFFSHPTWRFSLITLRILAVNVTTLMILWLGLFYTGRYESSMLEVGLNSLQFESSLLASVLAETGVRPSAGERNIALDADVAHRAIVRLSAGNEFHAVVFNRSGRKIADNLMSADFPPTNENIKEKISRHIQILFNALPTRISLPAYPEAMRGGNFYPGLSETLTGKNTSNAWRDGDNGHIVLTAATPVYRSKNAIGAVVLTRSGDHIDEAIHRIQLALANFLFWALIGATVLSVYLSETIGMPLLRLTEVVERTRQSLSITDTVPDFSYRRDEIGALSAALRGMVAALAERMTAIGSFAADISHEIKNPLASLKSAAETLALVPDRERQEKLIAVIKNDVDRLDRLITDISMASRVDSDLVRAEKSVLDLSVLLKNIVGLESENPGFHRRIHLAIDEKQKLPVFGNDVQLGQVFQNLIQNAASFISSGGKITISALLQGDKVIVHVDNDGPAIPEKNLESIFERFYSNRPEQEKFGLHSGLGLSISRQIIRAHQGVIFARNSKDEKGRHCGVRFTVILPVKHGSAAIFKGL